MDKLQVGDQAPDFETLDDKGNKVKLSDFRGKRVVLYFYPKDDTPGCTTQACNFRDNSAELAAQNTVVLGVSPDDIDSHQKFKNKFHLNFPLLVDEDHAIADTYGAWGEKENFGKKYMGIIRSQLIIDEDGKIVETHYNVKADESLDKALEALTA